MRIIKVKRVQEWADMHPDALTALERWTEIVLDAEWRNLRDVRHDFPHADPVTVASGRTVTVFNVRGKKYRMITAIHYNTQMVHTLRFYTHAEYDKAYWKDEL